MNFYDLNLTVYLILLVPVLFISMLYYILSLTVIFSRKKKVVARKLIKYPFVSIQIPTYNDIVAIRCAKKCLKMKYPKNRYEIIIGNDCTDKSISKSIEKFAEKHSGMVKVTRRPNRKGFKAGNLNNMLKYSKGEVIVIFDSDFVPPENFLERTIPYFEDQKVGCVQTRMGYLNPEQNIVTKCASGLLMIFHNFAIPLYNITGISFFCGSGGAIRKSILKKVGNWDEDNITEDCEFSVRLIEHGYKNIYLHGEVASGEVPFTLKGFVKQQMRWAYGTTSTFITHMKSLMTSNKLEIHQKLLLLFTGFGYMMCPIIIAFTASGIVHAFLVPFRPPVWVDLFNMVFSFIILSGFMFIGFLSLKQENKTKMYPSYLLGMLTVGTLISVTNTYALLRFLFRKGMKSWNKTPKLGNLNIV